MNNTWRKLGMAALATTLVVGATVPAFADEAPVPKKPISDEYDGQDPWGDFEKQLPKKQEEAKPSRIQTNDDYEGQDVWGKALEDGTLLKNAAASGNVAAQEKLAEEQKKVSLHNGTLVSGSEVEGNYDKRVNAGADKQIWLKKQLKAEQDIKNRIAELKQQLKGSKNDPWAVAGIENTIKELEKKLKDMQTGLANEEDFHWQGSKADFDKSGLPIEGSEKPDQPKKPDPAEKPDQPKKPDPAEKPDPTVKPDEDKKAEAPKAEAKAAVASTASSATAAPKTGDVAGVLGYMVTILGSGVAGTIAWKKRK